MDAPNPINLNKPLTASATLSAGTVPVGSIIAAPAMSPLSMDEIAAVGAPTIAATASTADKLTAVARMGDIDELGKSLGAVLLAAKKYDPGVLNSGFLGMFGASIQKFKNRYSTVDAEVDALLGEVDRRVVLFRDRVKDLAGLYQDNENRYHELGDIKTILLAKVYYMEHNKPVVDPNDAMSAQHLSDWNNLIDFGRKKVDDLERARVLCQLQAPQIMQMANNSRNLSDKFTTIKSITIPQLKQGFALYILNVEQKRGAEMSKSIDDLTNETLKKNSALLGQNTVAINNALARSSVDLSTLQTLQTDLIKSIDDVAKIHADMRSRIANEAPQIEQLARGISVKLVSSKP